MRLDSAIAMQQVDIGLQRRAMDIQQAMVGKLIQALPPAPAAASADAVMLSPEALALLAASEASAAPVEVGATELPE